MSWAAAYRLQPSDSHCVQQFDEAVFVAAVRCCFRRPVWSSPWDRCRSRLLLPHAAPGRVSQLRDLATAVAALCGVPWCTASRTVRRLRAVVFVAVSLGAAILAVVNEILGSLYFSLGLATRSPKRCGAVAASA